MGVAVETRARPVPESQTLHESLHHLEQHFTPEIIDAIEANEVAWHQHGYQPCRFLQFEDDDAPIFDITGRGEDKTARPWAKDLGWNDVAIQEAIFTTAYPIKQDDVIHPPLLSNPHITANLFGSVRSYIIDHYPEQWEDIREQMKDKLPVVDSFLHPILPLLPPRLQNLMIGIGIEAYKEDFKTGLVLPDGTPAPLGFWPPELGMNERTADVLAQNGVRFLVLGKNQIESSFEAPLYIYETYSGLPLIIYPFNHEISQTLSFGDISDAVQVANHWESLGTTDEVSAIGAFDWETINHQKFLQDGGMSKYFFNHLFNVEIPKRVAAGSLNFKRDISMARPANIKNSAWSCPHPDFGRWTGEGDCSCDGATPQLNKHKSELYNGLYEVAESLTDELNITSMSDTTPWEDEFGSWFLRERSNFANERPIGFEGVSENRKELFRQLLTVFAGMQSCAWFFSGDYERSMAVKSLDYVRERRLAIIDGIYELTFSPSGAKPQGR